MHQGKTTRDVDDNGLWRYIYYVNNLLSSLWNHSYALYDREPSAQADASEVSKEYLQIELEAWLTLGTNRKLDPEEIRRETRRNWKASRPHGIAKQIEKHRLEALSKLHQLRKEHFTSLDWPDLSPLEAPMPPTTLMPDTPKLHSQDVGRKIKALLIGINYYHKSTTPPLTGCCEDVNRISQFLTDHLFVPANHIKVLRDKVATRAGILDAIHDLLSDEPHVDDCSVVFYFAGYGSSYSLPVNVEDHLMEAAPAICPSDRGVTGPDGHIVRDIYIHELCILLSRIGKSGCQFTAVFDCCHSDATLNTPSLELESETSADYSQLKNRYLHPLPSCNTSNEDHIRSLLGWASWDPSVSEVLCIGACRDYEPAFESTGDRRGGLFTLRLIEAATSKESYNVTYDGFAELIGAIGDKHTRQTPTVRGKRRTSRVWEMWMDKTSVVLAPCLCGCDVERASLRRLERELWHKFNKGSPLNPTSLIEMQRGKVCDAEREGKVDPNDQHDLEALLRLQNMRNKSAVDNTKSSTLIRNKPSRYWAVVIGINTYLQVEPLKGCVTDAHNIKRYLVDCMRIPEAHVSLLVDKDATRANIWHTLLSLVDKSSDGDQLIVYFSGRGTMYKVSDARAICPVDRGTNNVYGKQVGDITEMDVYQGLAKLRHVNRAYMTMIWDCSFAATERDSKSMEPPQYHAVMNRYALPLEDEDADVCDSSNSGSPSDATKAKHEILVWESETKMYYFQAEQMVLLLTGCRKYEAGYEVLDHEQKQYQGQFTASFLHVAIQNLDYGHLVTYNDMIGKCHIGGQWGAFRQTPEATGFRKHDPMWD